MRIHTAIALVMVLIALLAGACTPSQNYQMIASDAWARPAQRGDSTAIYFLLENAGARDRLIQVSCPDIGDASMHATEFTDGVAQMVRLKHIQIPQGESFRLEPGRAHVLIEDLTRSLNVGDRFNLVLTFERGGDQTVDVQVQDR